MSIYIYIISWRLCLLSSIWTPVTAGRQTFKGIIKFIPLAIKNIMCYAVLQQCYDSVTVVLRQCYGNVTAMLRQCYGSVTAVLRSVMTVL